MVVSVPPSELQDFFDSHLTERDRELALESLRAAAQGDATRALDLYRQGLRIVGSATDHELLDIVLLGDEAPDWVLCRWIARQAYHWLLLTEDPRADVAVRTTLAATYELPTQPTRLLRQLGTAVAGSDWVCGELATYDLGGLTDYLDAEVSHELAQRAAHIHRWASTPLRGYAYEAASGDRLTIRDLGTDERRDVLHIGALAGTTTSRPHVLARVVPTGCPPGWMFAARPLDVDEQTAREVSSRPDAWITALATAVDDARVPPALGQTGGTCLISDVVLDPPPGPPPGADVEAYDRRTVELTEYVESLRDDPAYQSDGATPGRVSELVTLGVDPEIADTMCTVEMALLSAALAPEALPVVCAHAMLSLRVPGVFEALRRHSTGPDTEHQWYAVAAHLPCPWRDRCEELARRAGAWSTEGGL